MSAAVPPGMGPRGVPFTQFLRPDGRQMRVWIDRSPEIAELARKLTSEGVRLELEELSTGEASLEAVCDDEEGEVDSLAGEVVPNGEGVGEAVDRLVREAAAEIAARKAGVS